MGWLIDCIPRILGYVRNVGVVVCSLLVMELWCPIPLHAEGYLAGQLGALQKSSLTNVEFRNPTAPPNSTLSDIGLTTSPLYGLKAGYFFPDKFNWVGIETEFYKTMPGWNSPTVRASHLGGNPITLQSTNLDMSTSTFNLILRYPHKRIQPYVGGGLGIFWAKAQVAGTGGGTPITQTNSSVSTGVNLLAGLRVFVTDSVAIFGEYKYNSTKLDFAGSASPMIPGNGFRADYQPQHIVVGLGYHFK